MVALSPDQHTDNDQIENVGSDADRERGCIISEMVVEQAGEPTAERPCRSPLNSKKVGILQEASDAGNSSRTASTYAGMMPEKPSPKAAATVNRPVSFCVNRNAVIDAACQADPIKTVASPPMRSEITPQICRLRNAVPSSTDSIRAPIDLADTEIAAKSDQMALRHRHGNTTQHAGCAHHREHGVGRPAENPRLARPAPDAAAGGITSGAARK